MFVTSMLSGSLYNTIDPSKERRPPPLPTPVTFPIASTTQINHWNDAATFPDFQGLFASIAKPSDVSEIHEHALNIQFELPCPIDRLAPAAAEREVGDQPSSIERGDARSTDHTSDATTSPNTKLRRDFDGCIAELTIDNDTAFRVLAKTLPPGTAAPRLAHMRKFFAGLESMSAFWDCSLDKYYEVAPNELGDPAKHQRIDPDPSPPKLTRGPFNSIPVANDVTRGFTEFRTALPSRTPTVDDDDDEVLFSSTHPVSRYKGRRTGTGRDMPDSFRNDTVRAFVESATMPFFCTVAVPRQIPVVKMAKLSVSVRQTGSVYRLSKDRAAARQGRITGPLLGLQIRPETEFTDANNLPLADKSRLDSLREIGLLLQLAQERSREGKVEVKPGEGKWWTTTPRFGGAENEPNTGETSPTDEILAVAEEFVQATREDRLQLPGRLRSHRGRKTAAMAWKELKCGAPLWDSRTEYKAVGKRRESSWDEIYMVSSLNHHISILKLTVHDAYVETLTTGSLPENHRNLEDGINGRPWYRPRLERSLWYDLFETDQRIEAFRGLWNIMSYLTRDMD